MHVDFPIQEAREDGERKVLRIVSNCTSALLWICSKRSFVFAGDCWPFGNNADRGRASAGHQCLIPSEAVNDT